MNALKIAQAWRRLADMAGGGGLTLAMIDGRQHWSIDKDRCHRLDHARDRLAVRLAATEVAT